MIVDYRVYAFFHHSWPTSVTCIESRHRAALSPGYPHQLNVGASNIIWPGGGRSDRVLRSRRRLLGPLGVALYCWDTDLDQTCGLTVVDRVDNATYVTASAPVLIGGLMYFVAETGLLYCVDPASNEVCAAAPIDTKLTRAGVQHPRHRPLTATAYSPMTLVERPGLVRQCLDQLSRAQVGSTHGTSAEAITW